MIISDLVPALGWTLLHSLWQGALLFLVVLPLFHLLKNRPPQLRYGIACTALLLLLGGMAWTFGTQLEFSNPGMVREITPLPSLPTTTALEETIVPVVIAPEPSASLKPDFQRAAFSPAGFLEANVAYLVAIWGLGVLVFTFRWCNMLLLTFRLRKRGIRNLPPVWQERLFRLKRSMGVERVIGLVESNQIDSPLVIGHFKPIILLPIGLVSGLSVAQVEAILAHELAHVGRQDFVVNLFLTGLEVVLFYHPVYWWLAGKINQEREKCCDDVAVAACGNPRMYARTLLSVEEHRQSGFLAMGFVKKGGQLQNRIQRICQPTPRHHQSLSLRLWLLLPLLGCAVAFAYAGVSPIVAGGNTLASPDLSQQDNGSLSGVTDDEIPVKDNAFALLPVEEPTEATPEHYSAVTPLPSTSIDAPVSSLKSGEKVLIVGIVTPEFSQTNNDSLPKPSVPRLGAEPALPTAPKLPLTETEIRDLLAKGDEGRKQLRDQTDAYRASIENWNERLSEDYLQPWEAHRLRIMEAYADWSEALRAQADNELTYALAHNDMTELFEQALDQSEDTIEEAEDAIEYQPEQYVEGLEKEIKRGEKSLAEHGDRMDVHGIRMSMHSVRMKIHGGRMRVHSGRMKMHTTRMQLHTERMKSHQIIMAALEAELREALIADGLLGKDDQYFRLEVTSEVMRFNRKIVDPISLEPKYRAILKRYGKGDFEGNEGNTFMININPSGRNIGTKYNRN
ncbi:M56 family metallopeptidase [Neolewinella persica]|uniref:M56 family metallopeptidase n=1 Tax=Neolewinella persica TaxID=70998 RepID=UPI000477BAEA|nr:M56 family metallopeptidase [Neolewinella persica]